MTIIKNAGKMEAACLGLQKVDTAAEYRRLSYSMQVDSDDGILLYNNITGELIFLNEEDKKAVENSDMTSETVIYLINKWFFVPMRYNDVILCDQVNSFMNLICDAEPSCAAKKFTNFTILTTTDCNARCFYCYEAGRTRITMSEKVANDVADFIIESCRGNPVTFRWFGGEPLCNFKAIDIICERLSQNGIVYESNMVSNGYLFNESSIEKAVRHWNLYLVQITLDGTEDVYNRCKAYIYKDSSPYKKVMLNIKHLLDAGVAVKIRMNADEHNLDDLFRLTDILFENFGHYKKFTVYSHLLFEEDSDMRTYERRKELFKNHLKLEKYIESKGFSVKPTLDNYLRYRQCMADNPQATVVLPDGHLGRCEHFSDSNFWGSIYSENVDKSVINYFKEKRVLPCECDDCAIRPACIQLENCPDRPKKCDSLYKEKYIINTQNRIINTYYKYKLDSAEI